MLYVRRAQRNGRVSLVRCWAAGTRRGAVSVGSIRFSEKANVVHLCCVWDKERVHRREWAIRLEDRTVGAAATRREREVCVVDAITNTNRSRGQHCKHEVELAWDSCEKHVRVNDACATSTTLQLYAFSLQLYRK
jgi:hypothetical protein